MGGGGLQVYIRHAAIRLKKSGGKVPRIELVPAGPSMDLTIRRTRQPSADLMKEAMKAPKLTAKKKVGGAPTGCGFGVWGLFLDANVRMNVRHQALRMHVVDACVNTQCQICSNGCVCVCVPIRI